MTNDMNGLNAVVTGGTGALGSAVVRGLLARGATVHVPVYVAEELTRFAEKDHERVRIAEGVDLTDETSAEQFFEGVGSLYACVNVAGGFSMAPFAETTLADFQHLMRMNAQTAFLATRAAVRRIEGEGRIVSITAKPALIPSGHTVAYAMSKAAVATMTTCLADELASRRIWVNAVAPSIMDTPANRAAMPDADHAAWPKVEEVAATIVHLASPANGVTRGALVPVFGAS